ncbi:hypothetical protein [Streptomyces sp. NPDC059166]|uniref:hypothetical protein n=1 Tax=Streptomyces sp. NPDC059166 TaxID=3346752 RepID=UPI00368CA8C4
MLEREKARAAEQGSVASVVERELVETQQKVDLVKKKLDLARRTRQEAKELHVTAEVSAVRHELALERLRAFPPEGPEGEGLGIPLGRTARSPRTVTRWPTSFSGSTHRQSRHTTAQNRRTSPAKIRYTTQRDTIRRLHRRYERKAEHFLAFVGIASTLICFRRLIR